MVARVRELRRKRPREVTPAPVAAAALDYDAILDRLHAPTRGASAAGGGEG
jgi:hypothetical protein